MKKAMNEGAEEKTLYERLGGVFAIAAVVDRFSDQLLKNPKIVNANPQLKKWHSQEFKQRLPGLKFMRTLWVCAISGGNFQYTGKSMHNAHFDLHISPVVFDEVAKELSGTLDYFKVPNREKMEILGAFSAYKDEVTAGSKMKSMNAPKRMLHH